MSNYAQLAEESTARHFVLDPMSKGAFIDMVHHAVPPKTQYEYVFKFFIALQELDENRAFIIKLDNKMKYESNVGEPYVFVLSGTPCIPRIIKRLSTLYAANLTMDLEEVPDIGNFSSQANAGEFFRAFRAMQTSKMAIDKRLNRAELKSSLTAEMGPHHATFYAEYCTVEKFTEYLNGYPASQAVKDCIPFLIELESFQA